MTRNVTAVYRTHATADLVRRELEGLGISRGYIHVLPDDARSGSASATGAADVASGTAPAGTGSAPLTTGLSPADTGTTPAGGGTVAAGAGTAPAGTTEHAHEGVPHATLMDAVDDLYLPDDDTRTYKHSLQRGDHVVSVEASDDQVARVLAIMRRPEAEAHNLDTSDEEFRTAEDFPRREGYVADETRLGRRDPEMVDPYTRSYERGTGLDERIRR